MSHCNVAEARGESWVGMCRVAAADASAVEGEARFPAEAVPALPGRLSLLHPPQIGIFDSEPSGAGEEWT